MKNNTSQEHQIDHRFQQAGLEQLNIIPDDIIPIINKLIKEQKDYLDFYRISQVGNSYLNKPIFKITCGNGPIKLFLWSQMHGNESAATASLFDLINFIKHPDNAEWFNSWREKLTLHIVPMLNPDGADLIQRVNAQGIDINRDAKSLQSPEGRLLLSLAQKIKPEYGFNLHSQNRFYTVGETSNSAIISLLAPAYNAKKETNSSRRKAKQIVSLIDQTIQRQYPNQVGRYDDTYSYRSFGDLFSARGIATVLIEAGYCNGDSERQIPRRLTFLGILESINAIRDDVLLREPSASELLNHYKTIPFNNEDGQCDLLFKNLTINDDYCVDISINYDDDYINGTIDAIGDLSTLCGLKTIECEHMKIQSMKAFNVEKKFQLTKDKYLELLKAGYGYFIDDLSLLSHNMALPINTNLGQTNPNNWTKIGQPANFFISKKGKICYAIINSVVIDLNL